MADEQGIPEQNKPLMFARMNQKAWPHKNPLNLRGVKTLRINEPVILLDGELSDTTKLVQVLCRFGIVWADPINLSTRLPG